MVGLFGRVVGRGSSGDRRGRLIGGARHARFLIRCYSCRRPHLRAAPGNASSQSLFRSDGDFLESAEVAIPLMLDFEAPER